MVRRTRNRSQVERNLVRSEKGSQDAVGVDRETAVDVPEGLACMLLDEQRVEDEPSVVLSDDTSPRRTREFVVLDGIIRDDLNPCESVRVVHSHGHTQSPRTRPQTEHSVLVRRQGIPGQDGPHGEGPCLGGQGVGGVEQQLPQVDRSRTLVGLPPLKPSVPTEPGLVAVVSSPPELDGGHRVAHPDDDIPSLQGEAPTQHRSQRARNQGRSRGCEHVPVRQLNQPGGPVLLHRPRHHDLVGVQSLTPCCWVLQVRPAEVVVGLVSTGHHQMRDDADLPTPVVGDEDPQGTVDVRNQRVEQVLYLGGPHRDAP